MRSAMLAATADTEEDIPSFPLLVTPKIDGVRALIMGGQLVSRTFKPIPNGRIRSTLEDLLPEGADGEIYCGDLYTTTSTAMSFDAGGDFKFFWFDWAYDLNVPYERRVSTMTKYVEVNETDQDVVTLLIPHAVHNTDQLHELEKSILARGFEGIVLRIPKGIYKCGRSTLREGLMIKLKRFVDSEALIVGTEELIHKDNRAGDTLGSIIAANSNGTVSRIGTGYTADQRLALWANRDIIVGKTVKYRHSEGKNRPRNPVFLGIRHEDDT